MCGPYLTVSGGHFGLRRPFFIILGDAGYTTECKDIRLSP